MVLALKNSNMNCFHSEFFQTLTNTDIFTFAKCFDMKFSFSEDIISSVAECRDEKDERGLLGVRLSTL
jgi:hypothetical protein